MSDLIKRIDGAIERITSGSAPMRVPVDETDPDMVLVDCKRALEAANARIAALESQIAATEKQEPVAVIGPVFQLLYCRENWSDGLKVGMKLYAAPLPSDGWRKDAIQQKAVDHGFKYWRASDAHGVTGTIKQAEDLIASLIGVEVEITK